MPEKSTVNDMSNPTSPNEMFFSSGSTTSPFLARVQNKPSMPVEDLNTTVDGVCELDEDSECTDLVDRTRLEADSTKKLQSTLKRMNISLSF
jgi:hypothetical protein